MQPYGKSEAGGRSGGATVTRRPPAALTNPLGFWQWWYATVATDQPPLRCNWGDSGDAGCAAYPREAPPCRLRNQHDRAVCLGSATAWCRFAMAVRLGNWMKTPPLDRARSPVMSGAPPLQREAPLRRRCARHDRAGGVGRCRSPQPARQPDPDCRYSVLTGLFPETDVDPQAQSLPIAWQTVPSYPADAF